jgi:hypothetical protein
MELLSQRGVSRRKRSLRTFAVTGVAVCAAVVLAVPGAQAAGTPGWRFVAVFPQVQQLLSVSASSATNAWAVGQTSGLGLFTSHWNGKKWQPVANPNRLGGVGPLIGAAVAATAGARAWVFTMTENDEYPVTEVDAVEWTGTSWSTVRYFDNVSLSTAIAAGPGDVWGFGSDMRGPWAVHYNGTRFSRVAMSVNVSAGSGSAAAGDWVTGTLAAQPRRVVVLHWSKGAWRNVALPAISVPKGQQTLAGFIAAVTPASVWATVAISRPGQWEPATVLLHWNGKTWSKVAAPKGVHFDGLASDGHGGCWVASYTFTTPGAVTGLVMYHYSGGRWTHVPAPAESGYTVSVFGGNMQLIPGTRSVLEHVTLNPNHAGTVPAGAVLKYGP